MLARVATRSVKMQGSRRLLFSIALLLLAVTFALATHNDEESAKEIEFDYQDMTAAEKYKNLQSLRKILGNVYREPAALSEETHDRTKRGLRKIRRKFKKIEQKVRGHVNKFIGQPGSDRRRIVGAVATKIGLSG
ncbi:hypothetical protein B566_EDAN009592 [Ephemera danica]|nr:hypothetical protein B566_EDAN009592 [Ephemera danica]